MKVSIITPFYQGNRYMPAYQDMIDSNESRIELEDELEVILINDSPEVQIQLDGIHSTLKNWRIFNNKTNVGIHESRVRGLEKARGDFIIFLDQDDTLAPYAVSRFLDRAKILMNEGRKYCVIVSNARLMTETDMLTLYRTKYHVSRIGDLKTYITVGTQIISPGQCMIRREVIPTEYKKNILQNNGADDYFLWLLLLTKGIPFVYIGGVPLYTHTYTGENLSGDTRNTDKSTLEFAEFLPEAGMSRRQARTLTRMIRYKAAFREAGLRGKIGLSLRHFGFFFRNVIYKIRTRTPYGFHRS